MSVISVAFSYADTQTTYGYTQIVAACNSVADCPTQLANTNARLINTYVSSKWGIMVQILGDDYPMGSMKITLSWTSTCATTCATAFTGVPCTSCAAGTYTAGPCY